MFFFVGTYFTTPFTSAENPHNGNAKLLSKFVPIEDRKSNESGFNPNLQGATGISFSNTRAPTFSNSIYPAAKFPVCRSKIPMVHNMKSKPLASIGHSTGSIYGFFMENNTNSGFLLKTFAKRAFFEDPTGFLKLNDDVKIVQMFSLINYNPILSLPISPIDEFGLTGILNFFGKGPNPPDSLNKNNKNGKRKKSCKRTHPREILLQACGQYDMIPIEKVFAKLRKITKIGEGSYAEVYTGKHVGLKQNKCVYKLIPTDSNKLLNDEVPQKPLTEVTQELYLSQAMNLMRNNNRENFTTAFPQLYRGCLAFGEYPESLMEAHRKFLKTNESTWKEPSFDEDQKYLILEYENAGQTFEHECINNARVTYYALMQVTFALAAAEQEIEFEHRDLHLGNLVLSKTTRKYEIFKVNGSTYKIPTYGLKTGIIDYTLSRLTHPDEGSVFLDLSHPDYKVQFQGDGHYQFDIYRIMKKLNGNRWEDFHPKTNVYWLHYLVKEMISGKLIKYKNTKSKTHYKYIQKLKYYSQIIRSFDSATGYIGTRTAQTFKA